MAQESKNENRKQRIREAFHDGKQVERMPAREDMAPQHSDDSLRLERFYVAGNLDDFERLLNGPYQMEYYVTRNQIAAYEEQKIDEIYEYLTAHELLELPQAARSEYVLYRWNDTFANTENIRAMVERLKYQVECFNDALPYRTDQSYGDRAASQIRVIYRIT